MSNQFLLNTLHMSLNTIKQKLADNGIQYYNDDISRIEGVINQYPKLSKPPTGHLFSKKDEPTMLQTIVVPIEILAKKIDSELKREVTTIEKEMHGTQVFSESELKQTERYVTKKELAGELQKMIALIAKENKEFKEPNRVDLHLLPKK